MSPGPPRFTAADDLLHDVSGAGPDARESLAFAAPIPDEQLMVFLYLWREPAGWGRFAVVGGPDMDKPEYLTFEGDTAFEGTDLDDCTVGGLRLRQPEPLHSAELELSQDGLDLSVRFEGLHHPFSWHDNPSGCPAWAATDRYEQSCRTSGTIRLGDREVEFRGIGHRDHSWGPRKWNTIQHWKWMNATTEDHARSLHAMIAVIKGEIMINGYLSVDGELSPVIAAEATADLDDRLVHRALSGRFRDQLGRTMDLECAYSAGWSMPIHHLVLNEIGMSATLDGRPAVAHVEMGWPAAYIELASGETTATG